MISVFYAVSVTVEPSTAQRRAFVVETYFKMEVLLLQQSNYFVYILSLLVVTAFPVVTLQKYGWRTFIKVPKP
jgi:hypothetical protein